MGLTLVEKIAARHADGLPAGTVVRAGAALATVTSPDFAQAVAAYQKAQTTLRNTTRIALLDEQLYKDDAIARSGCAQPVLPLAPRPMPTRTSAAAGDAGNIRLRPRT